MCLISERSGSSQSETDSSSTARAPGGHTDSDDIEIISESSIEVMHK